MQFGFQISGGKQIPIFSNRKNSVLLVGDARPTLHRLFLDEIHEGRGASFFGALDDILPYIPPERIADVVLIEEDRLRPLRFNFFHDVPPEERSNVASMCVAAFHVVFPSDIATVQFDLYMLNAALAQLDTGGTLFALHYLITSKKYRRNVISQLKDTVLKTEWERFDAREPREQDQLTNSVQNRMAPLITDPFIRGVLSHKKSITLKDTSIVLVSLPDNNRAKILTALIMARCTGNVFIDSPKLFIGAGRPIIACDYLEQLPETLRTELLGSATIMATRIGVRDANVLEPYFNLNPTDHLTDLPDGSAYLRLEKTLSLFTEPHRYPKHSKSKQIRNRSRSQHTTVREIIEERIERFIENALD